MNNFSKMIFFFMLILSTLISLSANSWFSMWMGLEINLLSFIPLMIKSNNLMTSEASLKYFIIQAFASSILLFSSLMYMYSMNLMFQINFKLNYFSLMIFSSLMLKMGVAPFHFWFPNVIEGISWYNSLILMTWQKIAPMLLISYSNFFNMYLFFIIMSILLGAIGGLNQISIRKIMAFSSINHMGWMISALLFNEFLWLLYFMIYSFMSFSLIFMFNSFKLFYLNQMFSMFSFSSTLKSIFMINFLSLGGLPPFLGFIPKWMIIQLLSIINQNFMILMMIIMTLITLYFYLRISFSAFLLNYENMKFIYKIYFNNKTIIYLSIFSFFSLNSLFMLISLINFF